MSVSVITTLSNSNGGGGTASDIYVGGSLNITAGDSLAAYFTHATADCQLIFDDSGGLTWTTALKVKHPSINRWLHVGYVNNKGANASLNAFAHMRAVGDPNTAVPVAYWTFGVLQARSTLGAMTLLGTPVSQTATPGGGGGACSTAAINLTNPGIALLAAATENAQTVTALDSFTLQNQYDFGAFASRILAAPGAATPGFSVPGADSLIAIGLALLESGAPAQQRFKMTATPNAAGIGPCGGTVWGSSRQAWKFNFSGVTFQASLLAGDAVAYVDVTGAGYTNGEQFDFVISKADNTAGGVYVGVGTVEAGAA